MRKSMLILLLAWWLAAPTWGAELPREVRDALPAAAEEITEELEDPASLSEGLSRLWDRALGYVEEAVRQSIGGGVVLLAAAVLCALTEECMDAAGGKVHFVPMAGALAITLAAAGSVKTMMGLGQETVEELKKSARASQMKARGAQLTGSRMLSKKQVVEHLTRRGGDRAAAEDTARWLEELGAVDEAAYGAAIVRHYSAAGYGPGRIRQELSHRGIPRDLWEELLSQMPPAEEAAERYLRARCRNKTVDEALLRKLSAALQRRGFSWQDIQAPLRRLESEIQE